MSTTSLAAGRTKFTILTTKPDDEQAPTVAELNAGIDMSCKVLADSFQFTFADSDRLSGQRTLCTEVESEEIGPSKATLDFTLFRYWLEEGGVDPSADAGFAAVKEKGTQLWAYKRKTDKRSTEDWEAGDEIAIGARFETDELQDPGEEGKIRYRVPAVIRDAWSWLTVAAGA